MEIHLFKKLIHYITEFLKKRNYIIISVFQRENNFFILLGQSGRGPNGESNHAISLECLALALENISRQAVGVAEISFQTSEPNT